MLSSPGVEELKVNGRHIPQRRCVVCRTRESKKTFLRFYINPIDDELKFDPDFSAGGFGIYVCPSIKCIRRLPGKLKRKDEDPFEIYNRVIKALHRTLRRKVIGGLSSRAILTLADSKGRVYFYFRSLKILEDMAYIKGKLEQLCSRS